MECRVATTFDWEWGPSTLQRLGKAQALRVCVYIYILYMIMIIYMLNHLYWLVVYLPQSMESH